MMGVGSEAAGKLEAALGAVGRRRRRGGGGGIAVGELVEGGAALGGGRGRGGHEGQMLGRGEVVAGRGSKVWPPGWTVGGGGGSVERRRQTMGWTDGAHSQRGRVRTGAAGPLACRERAFALSLHFSRATYAGAHGTAPVCG